MPEDAPQSKSRGHVPLAALLLVATENREEIGERMT